MAFARMVPFYAQVHGATRPTLQVEAKLRTPDGIRTDGTFLCSGSRGHPPHTSTLDQGGGARNQEMQFLWMVPFYADTGP